MEEKKVEKRESLVRNSILNTLYQTLSIILPIFSAPYVSRVLTPAGVGVSSYTNSLVSYFVLAAGLGTVAYGTMMISKQRKDQTLFSKTFWEIELLTIFSSIVCLLIWIPLALLYNDYRIYLLVLSFNIVAVAFDISWLYSGLEKYLYKISVNFFFKIICIICIFAFVKTENDLVLYVVINSISILLGNLSMWLFLPKVICKTKIDMKNLPGHFKQTLVFFAPAIATSIYTILDKTLIGVLIPGTTTIIDSQGNEVVKRISELENGYYEQATKLINIIKSVSFAGIVGVMTSRASFLFEQKEKQTVKKLLNETFNITSFLTVGSGFGIAAIALTLIPTFFGNGYESTVGIIYILSAIPFIISVSNVLGGMYYTPSGRRKQSSVYLIIGACINLALNIPLILLFKAKGAAIASVIAEFAISLLYLLNCDGFLTFKDVVCAVWKKMVSGVVMAAAVFCFTYICEPLLNKYLLLLLQIVLGLTIYCLALLLFKDKSLSAFVVYFRKRFLSKKKLEEK